MTKSKRQAIYEWMRKNKENHGAVYKDGWVDANYGDFDRVRVSIAARYKFAEVKKEIVTENKIKLLIRIKENS